MAELEDQELNEEEQEEEEEEESSEDEADGETDYKSLYEAEKARADKAESDRKSALGNQRSQKERDDQLFRLEDTTAALAKTVGLLARAQSQDSEELQGELNKSQQEQNETRASRQFAATYDVLYNDLGDIVEDEDGNKVIDLDEKPEFVKAWTDAFNARDVATLSSLNTQMNAERRKVDREASKKALEEAKKQKASGEKSTKRKKADMDLGSKSGGAAADKPGISAFERGLAKRPDLMSR